MKPEVVELTLPTDFRQWFAVLNNPDRSIPWISKASQYVPGTATDPYRPEAPDPGLN